MLASYQGGLASYLCVGWCREEKCVRLVPTGGWVSGGIC